MLPRMRFSFKTVNMMFNYNRAEHQSWHPPLQRIKTALTRTFKLRRQCFSALHARDAIRITSAFKTAEMVCGQSLNIHVRPDSSNNFRITIFLHTMLLSLFVFFSLLALGSVPMPDHSVGYVCCAVMRPVGAYVFRIDPAHILFVRFVYQAVAPGANSPLAHLPVW
jgi:hypothetical protein